MADKHAKKTGFALLVALVVVSVVLSVGLVILDLTIKQVRLGFTITDSEKAFHAANAGMECARFIQRGLTLAELQAGALPTVDCFEVTSEPDPIPGTSVSYTGPSTPNAFAAYHEYSFTWGPGAGDRCTRVSMISANAPSSGAPVEVTNAEIRSYIPSYPVEPTPYICQAGSQCTIISVRGYNQACPASGASFGFGVIEREVLLEF